MKKIKYLIMGLVTVFGAASCADFLEVEPKDRVTGNALLSSDGGINAYMAGHTTCLSKISATILPAEVITSVAATAARPT